jgi:hypothetical protein
MSALAVGDGADPGTEVGPLAEEKALRKVQELVDDVVGKGAKVVCGGSRPDRPGYFYPPTVLSDVSAESNLMSDLRRSSARSRRSSRSTRRRPSAWPKTPHGAWRATCSRRT